MNVSAPTPPAARILVLTASYGEGHNAAARNLAAALDAEGGPGTARLADPFALGSPRLDALTRRGYLLAINRAPRLWQRFFGWIDRARPFPRHLWILRRERAVIRRLLAETNPAAVCSTYPVHGFILDDLARTGELRVPHYNVVTDSISIHSLWLLPRCAGWFVPNADTAGVLAAAGLDPALIHVSGFPVPELLAEPSPALQPPNLAAGHSPRVLFIIHSGTRHAEATARRLLLETDWEITCAVGRDDALRERLQRLARYRRAPAVVLGWTDQIPRLLLTHHAVISKAGGATTQEAIAARCPMIVNQIVPGQEEGNYELLRRHGIGAAVGTPAEVIATLQSAFTGRGAVWRNWRQALDGLARPRAACTIARHLLAAPDSPAPTAEFRKPLGCATPVAPAPGLARPAALSRHG